MENNYLTLILIVIITISGCSYFQTQENTVYELQKLNLNGCNYIDSPFENLILKDGYKRVIIDCGTTHNPISYAIKSEYEFYEYNSNNLKLLLLPFTNENQIEEFFKELYKAVKVEKIS